MHKLLDNAQHELSVGNDDIVRLHLRHEWFRMYANREQYGWMKSSASGFWTIIQHYTINHVTINKRFINIEVISHPHRHRIK